MGRPKVKNPYSNTLLNGNPQTEAERIFDAGAEAGIEKVIVAVNTYMATHGTRPKIFQWWQSQVEEWKTEGGAKL